MPGALTTKERCICECRHRNYLPCAPAMAFRRRLDATDRQETGMAGRDKDIDPASELVEEDEEQALPESEEACARLDEAAAPRAAGRAALLRYAKLAPSAPGVYRMLDAAGEVLYVGKAKNIRKRITSYTRPTGHDTRIERMIAATATVEFVSTATETEALLLEANLIKRLRPRFNVLLRDDKSFPYILITARPLGAADPQASRRALAPGQLLRAVRLGVGGQPHHHGAAARVPAALLLGRLLREPHAAVPAAPDQALLGAVHQRDRFRRICRAGARGQRLPLRQEPGGARRACRPRWRRRPTALDFERAAIYRDRLAALSAMQSTQGINPRSIEEADVFAIHQEGGFSCIEVFFFRTGQNWGNRAYFPKADRTLGPGEVLGAFLAQFYDDKPCPRCILLSHDIAERELLAEALTHQERPQGRGLGAAARREEGAGRRTRWPTRARRWAASSPTPRRSRSCSRRWPRPSACRACRAASRSTTTATSRAPTRSAP